MKYVFAFFSLLLVVSGYAQNNRTYEGKFETIDRLITSPSIYRNASGAPTKAYWQQRVDYSIKARIDEESNVLAGTETIKYYNNSPDDLSFLWVQLDQNINNKENDGFNYMFNNISSQVSSLTVQRLLRPVDFPSGVIINSIKDAQGRELRYIVNNTMMRVNLPEALASNSSMTFTREWAYSITDRSKYLLSREGYEYFPEDDNKVFLLGHWYPRVAVYSDTEGWHTKQFQKLGEFQLEFGDYEVELTVPADHIVAGTSALSNAREVLSSTQFKRFQEAKSSFDKPVLIVTPEEAEKNEGSKSNKLKTWKFSAKNVRDVAYASSRKFIWDAQAVKLPTNTSMAMSFYPKEGLPVWSEESTKAVKNALEVFSESTFDYPYPVCISVNTSNIGIEYPMISFNGGRPRNGQMSEGAKAGMIGTIVHEVGHNWFPMIVSSDERKWMWMDEGINTFFSQRTMAERYPQYPHTVPSSIVPYMKGDQNTMRPIMTNADNDVLTQMGQNFYQKPTVGYQMLRNSIVGQELFDMAIKEYANRWKYKHPTPGDFFRTIQEGTGTDLDWFWRGWFFTTDNVDIDLAEVKWLKMEEDEVTIENTVKSGQSGETLGGGNQSATDFSNGPGLFKMREAGANEYGQFLSRLDDKELRQAMSGKNIYQLKLKNEGGLVMPVIIEWTYADGTKEIERLPAQIWRLNEKQVTRIFLKEKEVVNIAIDPNKELPDANLSNNSFPRAGNQSGFDQFKKSKN